MREVKVLGVGVTPFGRHLDVSLKDLAGPACQAAFSDAHVSPEQVEAAYVSNALAGIITGQECIRGQVMLRHLGITDIPIINVDNADAGGGTAFHLAWTAVAAGLCEVALALGVEKMCLPDKYKSFSAIAATMDMERINTFLAFRQEYEASLKTRPPSDAVSLASGISHRSIFMDYYAIRARMHMEKYGSTQKELAMISEKNHYHGSLNQEARYRSPYTMEEIVSSPLVIYPLTRLMCSTIGDGASAVVLASEGFAKNTKAASPVTVAGSALGSGMDRPVDGPDIIGRVGMKAFEMAGIGPEDVSVAELHDPTVFGEVLACEELGFCPEGEGTRFGAEGNTRLGGRLPINTSGGLESNSHPVAVSGLRQIVEITRQLQGRAEKRQVEGAKVGLTQSGGGAIGTEAAAMSVQILTI
jgi:acetyl-CoA acyltransferase